MYICIYVYTYICIHRGWSKMGWWWWRISYLMKSSFSWNHHFDDFIIFMKSWNHDFMIWSFTLYAIIIISIAICIYVYTYIRIYVYTGDDLRWVGDDDGSHIWWFHHFHHFHEIMKSWFHDLIIYPHHHYYIYYI